MYENNNRKIDEKLWSKMITFCIDMFLYYDEWNLWFSLNDLLLLLYDAFIEFKSNLYDKYDDVKRNKIEKVNAKLFVIYLKCYIFNFFFDFCSITFFFQSFLFFDFSII